jgi:hypothetical protein
MKALLIAAVAALSMAAPAACGPHAGGPDAQRSYWLKVDSFANGKAANLRFNVTARITGKCVPLGRTSFDLAARGSWVHELHIAASCVDPVSVDIQASRHPVNVGEGLQCFVESVGNEGQPLVADGNQRATTNGPNVLTVHCAVSL